MDFPGWAPEGVKALWREEQTRYERTFQQQVELFARLQGEGRGSGKYPPERLATRLTKKERDTPELLRRLLSDGRMEWVWGRVRKLGGDRRATYYEGRKVTPEEDVARVAGLAFPGPLTKTELMTPAEFDRWVSRVQKTAGRLAQLVQATNLDSYVRRDHYLRYRDLERRGALGMYVAQREMKGGVEDYLPLPKDDWSVFTRCERQYKPPPLSELLRRLAREVEKADTRLFGVLDFKLFNFDGNGRHGMSKPRHPQARRQFFVRALTSFCQERLGGKQRRIVADVTSVAFQSDISQREIIRLSP